MKGYRNNVRAQLLCVLTALAGCTRVLGIDDLEFVGPSGGAAAGPESGGAADKDSGHAAGALSKGGASSPPDQEYGGRGDHDGEGAAEGPVLGQGGGDEAGAPSCASVGAGGAVCLPNASAGAGGEADGDPTLVEPVGDPSAYVSHDGTDVVLTAAENGHLYQLSGAKVWTLRDRFTDLSGDSAPAMAGTPVAYVRSDGTDSILYRGINGQVVEVFTVHGGSFAVRLGENIHAPKASGNPAPYRRSDGYNAVPYRADDNRIWELYLWNGFWAVAELSTGGPDAAGDPHSFIRGDLVNSVVYRNSGNQFSEIYLSPQGWALTSLWSPDAQEALSDGTAYVRVDGRNALVYVGGNARHIYELSSAWNEHTWSSVDLTAATDTPIPVGEPRAYARSDGIDAVVYADHAGNIFELGRVADGWSATNVSAAAGSPPAASNPWPYVRSDSTNAVVYRATDGCVYELAWVDPVWEKTLVYQKRAH